MNPASHSKRLLITGIAGFTGEYLAKQLSALGYEVYGTTIDEPCVKSHFQCDLCNFESVKSVIDQVQPNYIIHLAAISFVGEVNTSLIYDVNVIGTCNLLEALLSLSEVPKKVILASSATVYGDQGCEVLDEMMCPKPVNHYGCSKLAMEHMASGYMAKLPIIITRPFNYTGIGQEGHFLIPKIVNHYREGKKQIQLGNIHVEREFNDIRDVYTMYTALLESDAAGKTVNLCTGRGIALLNIIEMMNKMAGYEITVTINPAFVRKNEIKSLSGSTQKLESLIGKRDIFPINETLRAMLESK